MDTRLVATNNQQAASAEPSLPGVLLAMNDVPKGMEDEFTRWYHLEHLTDRLKIPGFLRARSYRAVDGQPSFMAIYDCETVEVLSSAPYRDQLAQPSPWTQEIMPHFLNMERSACKETWSIGEGTGGAAIVTHCKPIQGRESDARSFIREELGPRLTENVGTVRIGLWEVDAMVTSIPSRERDLRRGTDTLANWVLFIECIELAQVALALHAQVMSGDGIRTGLLFGSWQRYQMIYERHAPKMLLANRSGNMPNQLVGT
jgi:hypothetical protein